MVHSRIIRVSRDLHFAPSLPPHPDSLEWVAHGSLSRGFVDPSLPVAPSIAAALETALRFAHQLILHPVGLHHAAMLLGHNNAPDALIAKAIRRVLSTRRWTICLDKGIGAGKALHCSPTRLTLPVSASESTLFFGLESAQKLSRACESGPPLDRARELLLAAVDLSGALVHALRLQYASCTSHDHRDGDYWAREISRDFERAFFGGILARAWDRERVPKTPPDPDDAERICDPSRRPIFDLDKLFLEDKRRRVHEKRGMAAAMERPMVLLSIRTRHDSAHHRVDDLWIEQVVTGKSPSSLGHVERRDPKLTLVAYDSGKFDQVSFPVVHGSERLEYEEYLTQDGFGWSICCRKGAPERGPPRPPRYSSLDAVQPPPPAV